MKGKCDKRFKNRTFELQNSRRAFIRYEGIIQWWK